MSYSPRVIGTERADFSTLEDLLTFKKFKGKKDQDFAIAVWKYFTSKVDGSYHFWTIDEWDGYPDVRFRLNDPLKFINVYGWMICGQHSMFQNALLTTAGYRSRMVGIKGHVVGEIYYGGQWHLLDIDMHSYYMNEKGVIASIEELTKRPDALIMKNKNISEPNNLPDRPNIGYRDMYRDSRGKEMNFPHWITEMHTMDFHLRPGETVERSSGNTGRYNLATNWRAFFKKYGKEWHGGPGERYAPFRSYGNGRLVYAPDLTSRSNDVELGAWSNQGVTPGPKGLAGPGTVVFRVQCPYLFTGRPVLKKNFQPEMSGKRVRHTDGPAAYFKGSGDIAVATSPDGVVWNEECSCKRSTYTGSLDLTELAQARYEYFVRIRLGEGGVLTSLRVESPFMVAPISLPRLKKGRNVLTFKTGDRHGLNTVPYILRPDFRSKASVEAGVYSILNGQVKQGKPWSRIVPVDGEDAKVVMRLDAPAGKKIAWLYAWACIDERDPKDPAMQARMEFSEDGANWREVACIDIPGTGCGWDTTLQTRIKPDVLLDKAYIRITSPRPINALENRLNLLTGQEAPAPPTVTIRWREGSKQVQKVFKNPGAKMVVTCKKDPAYVEYDVAQASAQRVKGKG